MELTQSKQEHIAELVRISIAAFDSDINVGATEMGEPPEYDSINWHTNMMNEGHLFTAIDYDKIVGGAVIFLSSNGSLMNIGRIFINPLDFKKGYGSAIMSHLENAYPGIDIWKLDTPIWNIRTNQFYTKIGYKEVKRDDEFIYYQKSRLN